MTGRRDDRPPIGGELERRLREAVAREGARETAGAGPAGEPAPSPETLLDALAGRLTEPERLRTIDRAAATAEGRRELATLHVALGAADATWPEAGARRAAWWLRPASAAAAALLLATGLGGGMWWRMTHASPNAAVGADPVRAGDAPPGPAPSGASQGDGRVALVPAAVTARAGAPTTLAWRALPGAVGYDVEVLAPAGTVVHAATTRDTTLLLPPAAVPARGVTARWWVRARAADGTTRRSAFGTILGG